jgi:antitoxin PrlF
MRTVAAIEKTCTVTRKGQTTLPLAFRQLLGVPEGGQIVVRAEDGRVILEPVEEGEHHDPAISAFLRFIADDIATGRHVNNLPDDLAETLRQALDEGDNDLDETIEGDVCL